MPRVGLNIVEEAPNDITDRCSHRSDPGNIDTQAGALSSLYYSAPQGCLLYVWKAIFTLVFSESFSLCNNHILRLYPFSLDEM